MRRRFRYAAFDAAGRCTGIMSSPVNLRAGYRVGEEDHPADLYLCKGKVRRREAVALTASRALLVCDGRDAVIIGGLPSGAPLRINGAEYRSHRITATDAGMLVVEAAGAYRSDPVLIEADTLAHFAAVHSALVDQQAEAARGRHTSPLAHQQAAYHAKEAEARALIDVRSGASPFLDREAAARGISARELAGAVIAKADTWRGAAAEIEALRIAAKRAIAVATGIEAMIAAADIKWPDGPANEE